MNAYVGDCTTDILLSKEEAIEYCKIGEGMDCCIWLCVGTKGLECLFYNRPVSLIERWQKGLTVAKRDGCDKVRSFNRFDEIEVEF